MTTWRGMHAGTGTHIGELDHIRQSVSDILTTPVGARVMRRDYGSYVPDLIDQPINRVTRQRLFGAAVMALHRWEPRIRINKITFSASTTPGQGSLTLEAVRTDGPRRRALDPIIVQLRGGI